MAFQIFDDVAFYFASVCLLAVILIPYSIYLGIRAAVTKVKPPVDPHSQSSAVCGCPDCVSKTEFLRLHGEKGVKKRKWGMKHVLFVLGWLLFAYLIFQLPSMQTQNMATFNPYDIIGVATDASDAEIKRAYRKKALELHPDVVAPDQRDAAAGKFQLLAKAMELLSDADQRRKWDEGGETGTYTRPTGSIGLPSWLTEKKNEVPVLLLYFMLMILLPPICVYLWWRDARNYHDTGVLNQTVGHFFNFLKEDHSVKFLIETLATAWEYRVLEDRQPVGPDVDKLLKTLKDAKAAGSGQVKAKYNRPYIVKANALLHAYLLRLPIPDSLLPDLHVVLKDAHRLLNVMLDISLSRLFLRPSLAILDLQQMITQALWVHKSPLLQLPSFDEQDLRAGQRKGLNTIVAFKKADDEKKKAVFGHSDAEWKSINAVAALLPAISVDCSYEVADEKGLYEGDIVTLNVKITRLRDLNQLTESETSSVSMEGGEEEDGDDDDAGAAKAAKRDRKDKRKAAAADEAKSSTNGDSGKHDSALGDAAASSSSTTTTSSSGDSKEAAERKARGEASRAEFEKKEKSNAHLTEEERIQQLQLSAPREKDIDPENAPFVHCPRFPFVKRERWVLLLVERGVKTRIIAKTKSAAFDEKFEFPVTFRAPRAGTIVYEVHAKCDSYIGVDQIKTVPLKIEARPSKPIKLRELESESDEEDEDNEGDEKEAEEEPAAPGKWYYLGASTMWELLLNVLVLGVLFFFAKEFLQSRGYWQRYVTPVIDVVTHIAGPPAKTVYGVIAPVADPVVGVITAAAAWLGQKLYSPVDPAELKAKRKKYHDDY